MKSGVSMKGIQYNRSMIPAREWRSGRIARCYDVKQRGIIVKYREKLGYSALGGLLMLVGMLAANLTPLTAQRDSFGEITCTGLKVVDSEGNQRVRLTGYPDGGIVAACDSNGNLRTSLVGFEEGGKIFVMGHGGEERVTIGVDENGGQIVVHHKDGKSRVAMWSAKDGGPFCNWWFTARMTSRERTWV